MRIDMVMPQMGESITEGTIVRWTKKVGDLVAKDENVLDISTDKVDSEIPSPAAGRLVEIRAKEGETIPVGQVIAVIETEAGAAAAPPRPRLRRRPPPRRPLRRRRPRPAPARRRGARPGPPAARRRPRPRRRLPRRPCSRRPRPRPAAPVPIPRPPRAPVAAAAPPVVPPVPRDGRRRADPAPRR